MGRSRLRPAIFPNCPPYLNFVPGGEQYEDGEVPPEELEGVLSCTLAAGCSPSILEMFSRLCGLSNCITWGLSQVKHCHRWNLPSAGSCRSSRACVGPCDCVRQGPPHLLPHAGVRRQDQQVPKHGGNLQEGQALHKLPRDAEEVWQEDFQLHSKDLPPS